MLKKSAGSKIGEPEQVKKYQSRNGFALLEMCKRCYSFKYENEWHIERPKYRLELEYDPDERIFVQFSRCPACVEESLSSQDVQYA